MAGESNTLIVRHLPAELSSDEQEDLLRHFGAISVRCMGNTGRLRHIAFATFPSHSEAKTALRRLHELEVLNRRLFVQFSHKRHEHHHPQLPDTPSKPVPDDKVEKVEDRIKEEITAKKKVAEGINSVSKTWGLEYPYNPRLQYIYPPPTVSILTNIANALATVPKLYVQVLHLMNKMCLPSPFGPVSAIPPLSEDKPATIASAEPLDIEESSTEESEMESEGEENKLPLERVPQKRSLATKVLSRKRPKLQQLISAPQPAARSKTHIVDTADVFEAPTGIRTKKFDLKMKLPEAMETGTTPAVDNDQWVPVTQPTPAPAEAMEASVGASVGDMAEPSPQVDATVTEGGFGKLEPQVAAPQPEEEEEEEEEWGKGRFISSHRLRKGRLSGSEMRDISVFRNYKEGDPTARLYIKNLAKNVTTKDLHYIFGRYVDWKNEDHKLMFDLRLMQEGRMKGQAFITLPTEKDAKDALRETNGFVLKEKPIVVQFARSAKPKEADGKDSGKKK